ncbi:MAG: hypothetical protein ACTSQ8_24585 [Candidatus Helarchaeota archaeon]
MLISRGNRYIFFIIVSPVIFMLVLGACANAKTLSPKTTLNEESVATLTLIPTKQPTVTSTPTQTSTSTITPKFYKVTIQAFHDYNGNGEMDEGELPLEGIIASKERNDCTTDNKGLCILGFLPEGENGISIDSSVTTIENLDYFFHQNDVFKSKNQLIIDIKEDIYLQIALGQGFLPQCPVSNV